MRTPSPPLSRASRGACGRTYAQEIRTWGAFPNCMGRAAPRERPHAVLSRERAAGRGFRRRGLYPAKVVPGYFNLYQGPEATRIRE